MFKNIVVATDGSVHALKAAKMAADIAAKFKAKLTVVTVLPATLSLDEIEKMPQAKRFSKGVREEIKRSRDMFVKSRTGASLPAFIEVPAPSSAIAEVAQVILNETEKAVRSRGLKDVECLAVGGRPAASIVETAKKLNADLIVMGTRGLSDLKGIVFGSTSHKVLHLASCPCLCVR